MYRLNVPDVIEKLPVAENVFVPGLVAVNVAADVWE
jgi:hypothetical protein